MKCYYCDGKGYKDVSYWSMMKGEMGPLTREPCRPCHETGKLSDGYMNWYEIEQLKKNKYNDEDD